MTMHIYRKPDGPLTAATFVENARCIGESEFWNEDALAFAAGLLPLEFHRLRANLRDARVREPGGWARHIYQERTKLERSKNSQPDEPWRKALRLRDGHVCASVRNLQIILENTYGERIAFDEMAAKPCLDGKPIKDEDITQLRCDLEGTEDLEFAEAELRATISLVARGNTYHPVRDYLGGLKWDGKKRIAALAGDFLGAADPLSAKLLGRTLIAAVARAFEPGCKVDTCLVLVGDEGLKKSTFFRTLGGAWFEDSKVDITDRKGMMLMHSAWIYEWPEVDRMLEKKHDSDVKAYITQQNDSFVPMYGRSVEKFFRSNICVGTTNKEKFVTSHTGSRRWWIVTVLKRVDIPALVALREQIWAEAVHLYNRFVEEKRKGVADDENGYRWWLNEDEEKARAGRNEEHLMQSPDVERTEAWLAGEPVMCSECKGTGQGFGDKPCAACSGSKAIKRGDPTRDAEGREYVTCSEILDMLSVGSERQETNAYRAVNVLRRLGWRSGKRIRPQGGKVAQVTPYYAPAPPPMREMGDDGDEA